MPPFFVSYLPHPPPGGGGGWCPGHPTLLPGPPPASAKAAVAVAPVSSAADAMIAAIFRFMVSPLKPEPGLCPAVKSPSAATGRQEDRWRMGTEFSQRMQARSGYTPGVSSRLKSVIVPGSSGGGVSRGVTGKARRSTLSVKIANIVGGHIEGTTRKSENQIPRSECGLLRAAWLTPLGQFVKLPPYSGHRTLFGSPRALRVPQR
jgi:hypothetical protein